MIFTEASIAGAFLITPEPISDERGYFARVFDREELAARGLVSTIAQSSISFNGARGTLRGMHYQLAPHQETKLVSCIRGAIFDVIIDLRAGSPSYRRWFGARLDSESFTALYVPAGCAHGFITLEDETLVSYVISAPHHAASARGVRYDDPTFAIEWPFAPTVISARDRAYEDFRDP